MAALRLQVNMGGVKAEQSRALAGVMAALNDGFASGAHGQKRKASGSEDETAKRRKFLETLLEGDDSGGRSSSGKGMVHLSIFPTRLCCLLTKAGQVLYTVVLRLACLSAWNRAASQDHTSLLTKKAR